MKSKDALVAAHPYSQPIKSIAAHAVFLLRMKRMMIKKSGSYERRRLRNELIIKEGVICGICNKRDTEVLHHKDKNRENNKLDNLRILCRDCHRAIHKEMRKDELKTSGNPFYKRKEANV